MYSFYLRTFLSRSYVLLQYHILMYTELLIWWCIFSLLYKDNHECYPSLMYLVLGSFYYTSQTESCLHGSFLFFFTCSCISNVATKGGEVQMWNKCRSKKKESKESSTTQARTMSTSHIHYRRTLGTATAWLACHLRGPRPILGQAMWDF